MSVKEECELVLVSHPRGIASGCKVCRMILRRGTWVVGLKIGEFHYIVCEQPPPMCCGEEKKVMQSFDSQAEAQVLADAVRDQLNQDGTTENLALCELKQDDVTIKIAPVH